MQTPYLKRLLSLLLFVPFIAVSAPIPKKRSSKQLMVTEATCLKYSADPKQCAPVDLDLEQIQNVVLNNPNSLTCSSYQMEVVSSVGAGICRVGGAGGGSGGTTAPFATSQTTFFTIPRATNNYAPSNSDTANNSHRVEIPSYTGSGIPNLLITGIRHGIAHIFVETSGSLSITLQDQITISRLNISSGGTAQLAWQLVHWSAAGNFLRSWTNAHVFSEAVFATDPMTIDISLESGLIPVNARDHFTLRFFFSSSQANKEINFNFPDDPSDQSFDDRFEFIFFPPASTSPFSPTDRANLEGAVELSTISLSDTDLVFASVGGMSKSIDLANLAADTNPITIRDKLQELSGNDRLDASAIKNLPAGGGGASIALGPNRTAVFQVPTQAAQTLTSTAANTPVEMYLSSLDGTGIGGLITNSVVSTNGRNEGRITIEQAGYVNVVFEDEIKINSSTAGSSGNVGELIFTLAQYNSSNIHQRDWVTTHPVEDPISYAIKTPIGLATGLTPVSQGDYFKLRVGFESSNSNKNINYEFPADNPELDERLEFIYFPLSSVVANRFDGLVDTPSSYANQAGKFLTPNEAETDLIFTDPPDGREVALPAVPSDLTSYVNGQILRVQPPPPAKGQWLEVIGANMGEQHSFRTVFEADANNASQDTWAVGTDLNYGYSSFGDVFGELYTADGGKSFSASDTPIMRMEIEQEVATRTVNPGGRVDFSFNTTYTLLIRKTDLATAPPTIFVRYYTGPPANNNQVTTIEFMKGPDNPDHSYHTYVDRNGADISVEDLLSVKYFNIFRSSPPTGDQTSNPLNFHEAKSTREIDSPASVPRSTNVTLDITNRIINIGHLRDVDKTTAWQAQGLTYGSYCGQFTNRFARLASSGDAVVGRGGAILSPSLLSNGSTQSGSQNNQNVRFYRLQFSSDKTDLTATEITLNTGVAYPSDFPTCSFDATILADGKMLVTGGFYRTTQANYWANRKYNNKLYVLTIDETTNKITNIRTLNHNLFNSGAVGEYLWTKIYQLTNGDIIIYLYRDIVNRSNLNTSNYQMGFQRLQLGETTDALRNIFTGSVNDFAGFPGLTSNDVATSFPRHQLIYPTGIVKGTNYYYISLSSFGRNIYTNIVRSGRKLTNYVACVVKIPISNTTSLNRSCLYSGSYTSKFPNVFPIIPFLDNTWFAVSTRTNPPNSYNLWRVTKTQPGNPSSATATSSEIATYSTSYLSTQDTFLLRGYNDDSSSSTLRFYDTQPYFISRDGSLGIIRGKSIFGGDATEDYNGWTGYWYVDVTGDTQVVVNRAYSSQVGSVEGHELTYGVAFPLASLKGDTHVFDQDVASGLTWRDTDGTTTLTSASLGDVAVYNGSLWVKKDMSWADVDNKVPQQFRSDADTTGQYFQPKCFWLGTTTQLNAVTTKVEDCMYIVPKTSQ